MKLNADQKKFLLDNFNACPDLLVLTRRCFNNDELDGRTTEGKAVKKFLLENNLEYTTTKRKKAETIELTEEQKEFAVQEAANGGSSLSIAKTLFPDRKVKHLGAEMRAVLAVIKSDDDESGEYAPPKAASRIIKKIEDATGVKLEEAALHKKQKDSIDKLRINLNNNRFRSIINGLSTKQDQNLFEDEFIRLTWDKPDLLADEITLYMNVCKDIVLLEIITRHLSKLTDLFDEQDDQTDYSIRLSEIIKAKSKEYHDCEGRVESLIKRLQGDRSQRIQKRVENNESFLSVVEAFQEHEERQIMLEIANRQKKLVEKEADRLETMPEFKARILGVGRKDVV